MDKQQTQYQLIPKKNERCSQIIENSQIWVSRHFGFVYHDTNGQNHGPVWKTQSFLLSGICAVILWQDHYGKGQFEKILLKHGWEKIPNCECLFVHREKRIILICVCGWHKIGWKEILILCGKYSTKYMIWEKPTSFLHHVHLGCNQRQRQISKDIVGQ